MQRKQNTEDFKYINLCPSRTFTIKHLVKRSAPNYLRDLTGLESGLC